MKTGIRIENIFPKDIFFDSMRHIKIMDVIKLHIPILDPDNISADDIINIRKKSSPDLVPTWFIIRLSF
jgi:hypothetical protein